MGSPAACCSIGGCTTTSTRVGATAAAVVEAAPAGFGCAHGASSAQVLHHAAGACMGQARRLPQSTIWLEGPAKHSRRRRGKGWEMCSYNYLSFNYSIAHAASEHEAHRRTSSFLPLGGQEQQDLPGASQLTCGTGRGSVGMAAMGE